MPTGVPGGPLEIAKAFTHLGRTVAGTQVGRQNLSDAGAHRFPLAGPSTRSAAWLPTGAPGASVGETELKLRQMERRLGAPAFREREGAPVGSVEFSAVAPASCRLF
jgi:hypothetical protein